MEAVAAGDTFQTVPASSVSSKENCMLEIQWQPEKNSDIPLSRQIYLFMLEKIKTGQWTYLTKLPPQRQLAQLWQVNRSTVATALADLQADGWLTARQGSGIWVANNPWSSLSAASADWSRHLKQDAFASNLAMIQAINQYEPDPAYLRLGTGELAPELFPVQELQELVQATAPLITNFGYSEPQGLLYLRQQISRHLAGQGITAGPENILIVSGALQALQLICFGLLSPKDRIFLDNPSYLFSLKLFQSLGLHFTDIPLTAAGPGFPQLEQDQRKHPHAFYYTIPSFHNPTGSLLSLAQRQQLLQLAQAVRLPLIEDDVYGKLWLDEPAPPSLKSLDANGLVLYISSLSKTIGPGLRIGWVVGTQEVIQRLADLKMQQDYGCSILSQWTAARWLELGYEEKYLAQLRQQLRQRRQSALDALAADFRDLATWVKPAGGFYIWLTLKKPVKMKQLFDLACQNKILIHPGEIYGLNDHRHLRISYAYESPPRLQAGLKQLAQLIRDNQAT